MVNGWRVEEAGTRRGGFNQVLRLAGVVGVLGFCVGPPPASLAKLAARPWGVEVEVANRRVGLVGLVRGAVPRQARTAGRPVRVRVGYGI